MRFLRFAVVLVAAVALVGMLGTDAPAADVPAFERSTATRPAQTTPGYQPDHGFVYTPTAPAAAPRGPQGGVGGTGTVLLKSVVVTGNTRIGDAEIAKITGLYIGHRVSVEDLSRMRDEITLLYTNSGYISSGAVLPPQDVATGIVHVNIVEGTLEGVSIQDNSALDDDYLLSRFGDSSGEIVNVRDLEDRFRALLDDPAIKQVDVDLRPGTTQGKATVVLKVKEADRYIVQLSAANDRSPSTGGDRASIQGFVRNVAFSGDDLTLDAGVTEGSIDGHIGYSVPLTPDELKLTVSGDYSHAEAIEEPVNELDILSESLFLVAGLSYPVIRHNTADRSQRLTLLGSVAFQHSETSLDGVPFSFSPGAVDGVTEYWTADAGIQYSDRQRLSVFAAGLDLTIGLDALEPDRRTKATPDADFWLLSGRAQYVRQLTEEGLQLIARAEGQYTDSPMFVPAKFAAGGLGSVRGYRKNRALGDIGVTASVELQQPVWWSVEPNRKDISLFVFTDVAHIWNAGQPSPEVGRLWGVGGGVQWTPTDWASLRVTYGHAIDDVPLPADEDMQDRGVYFQLTLRPSDLF